MICRILAILNDILRELKRDKVGAFAAQTTFFLVVSALPFFILFGAIIQNTAISEEQIYHLIELSCPEYIAPFLISVIKEMYTNSIGILSVAIIGAMWSSAKGVQCLTAGLNEIYDIEENRNWFVLRFRAIAYTLLFILALLFSIVFLMLGKVLRKTLLKEFPMIGFTFKGIMNFRHLILLVFLFLLFWVILRFLPNRRASFRSLFPAALAASLCWVLLSVGIGIYIDYFDGFSMYGSMTAIMLILLHIYFGMYILLICAEVDSMYERPIRMWWVGRKNRRN